MKTLFGLYSWITNLFWLFMDLIPFPLRHLVFRIILKSYGKDGFIDYKSYIRYPSKVTIGNNVTINRGCRIFCSYYHKHVTVSIENNVAIGPEVTFYAASHDYSQLSLPDTAASIHVHKYAWIGGGSIILPGVTIGEGAIVAAGSVVTRDINPYTVVAGIPAKFVKYRNVCDSLPGFPQPNPKYR